METENLEYGAQRGKLSCAKWLGALLALAAWLGPTNAHAKPNHEGFTGDLGLGLSVMSSPPQEYTVCGQDCVTGSSGDGGWQVGLAPLSLSLGGFITPRMALLGRTAGTSYFRSGEQIVHTFYGVVAELWPLDALYVSAGAGLGLYGANPLLSRNPTQSAGWALDFRVGAALAQGTNHDFTLSLEAIPGFYDGENVIGTALVGAWKWY